MKQEILRLPAEQLFQKEIDALIAAEKDPVPTGWKMSPRSVRTYICGGKVGRTQITPKYIGHERLVEIAISTLVTDRALLLIGEPGTAKSWLSEHLCAAINGDSTKVIQGTAGTTEEQLRYSWNYAMLLAQGPSEAAMLKSPVFTAMETGTIARMEEISRCASEVQDALISILSEKRISVPELNTEIAAKKGFSVIATANTRDKGVNEMSSALKRRFNFETVMPVREAAMEKMIILNEVNKLAEESHIQVQADEDVAEILASTYHELREGVSSYGHRIDKPSAVMSTAEAVSVYYQAMITGYYYGDSHIDMDCLVQNLVGAVSKENKDDLEKVKAYFNTVIKDKSDKEGGLWKKYYEARKWLR